MSDHLTGGGERGDFRSLWMGMCPPQKVNKLEEKNSSSFFYKKAMIKLSLGYLTNMTLSGYYDIC